MAMAGVPLFTIAEIIGHRDINVTGMLTCTILTRSKCGIETDTSRKTNLVIKESSRERRIRKPPLA
jgi:hypothetical protein